MDLPAHVDELPVRCPACGEVIEIALGTHLS